VRKLLAFLAVLGLVAGLAACGSDDKSSDGGGSGSDAPTCNTSTSGSFEPVKADTLTVATSLPAPGFWDGPEGDVDPDSLNGGYEYGMAEAMAKLAGLTNVEFKNVSFDALQAGQTSGFDVAFSQITITPERAEVVCFTDPYFSSDQGVLVRKGTAATTPAEAKKLKWGVQGTTTGQTFLDQKIKPDSEPRVFQDTPAMFTALDAEQIDAVLLDTAIVLGQAAASDGKLEVVAQYKTGESYGGLLESGTKNLGFINEYISTMKSDGTLDQLNTEYLVPVFKGDPTKIPYLEP
jgi:polar amino acid transport system substrate-binding protein